MTTAHNKIEDYSWLNNLPNWSLLSAKDVNKIFGYKLRTSIATAAHRNIFPKPDKHIPLPKGKTRAFWTVATIKKEINRRLKMEKENV